MDSKSLFLTPNTDTIDYMGVINLSKGPMVVEQPPPGWLGKPHALAQGVHERNAFLHSKVRWYGFFRNVRADPRFPALAATLVAA